MIRVFLLLLLGAQLLHARQFTHNTGNVSLIVDDEYLGGFVYHNLGTGVYDNLWRFFIALCFGEECELLFHGQANDEGELASSDFILITSSMPDHIDTLPPPDTTTVVYEDTESHIRVTQVVVSEYSGEYYIDLFLTIKNIWEDTLADGRLLLFYEGDIPEGDYLDDCAGRDTTYHCVYEYDYIDSTWTGFLMKDKTLTINSDIEVSYGNYVNWYENGLERGDITGLITGVVWDSSFVNTDCGVYEVVRLPQLLPGESIGPLGFSFVAGWDLEQFEEVAERASRISTYAEGDKGEVDEIELYLSPNPFRNALFVGSPFPCALTIYDITGRIVYSAELAPRAVFNATKLPAGLLLYRIRAGESIKMGKVIHLK